MINPSLEVWKPILQFPRYSVSDHGRIMNETTGRFLVLLRNKYGNVNVGLVRDKVQHRRSVPLLVADAFLPKPENPRYKETFNTPIHLNGDFIDNRVVNLMWRPRWFAMKYIAQFKDSRLEFSRPIRDVSSGEVFETIWDAVTKYGLLGIRIRESILNNTSVWPTNQTFHAL